jgi:hypothetical protein
LSIWDARTSAELGKDSQEGRASATKRPGAVELRDSGEEERPDVTLLSAHSDIARVSLATIPTGPNALRVAERLLTILLAGGVPSRTAAWGIDRLFLYVSSDAYEGSLHLAKQRASGKDLEGYIADFIGQVRDYFANLPPEHFPNTVKYVDELVSADGDERFEFGLDLFVQGLAARVDTTPDGGQGRP